MLFVVFCYGMRGVVLVDLSWCVVLRCVMLCSVLLCGVAGFRSVSLVVFV